MFAESWANTRGVSERYWVPLGSILCVPHEKAEVKNKPKARCEAGSMDLQDRRIAR